MRDYIKYHPIKFLIWVLLGAALLSGLIILILLLTAPKKDYVAIVGNKKITKTQYQIAREQCEAGNRTVENNEDLKRCDDIALENVIFQESLQQEATNRNINVGEKIQKEYQNLVSAYKSEGEMLEYYNQNFKLTKNDILNNIKTEALKDKLSDTFLRKVSVIGTFVRYDIFENSLGEQKAKDEALRLLNKYYLDPIQSGATEDDLTAVAEKLRKENPKYDNFTKTITGVDIRNDLNETTAANIFNDTTLKDWGEIKKLKNIGETTPSYISPIGGAEIWRLEGRTGGEYNSWDEYKTAVTKKSKISFFPYRAQESKLSFLKLNLPQALAADGCAQHMGGYRVSRVYIHGTEVNVPANTVHVAVAATNTSDLDAGGSCPGARASGTMNLSGYPDTIFNTSNLMSCMSYWNVTFTPTNSTFYTLRYYNHTWSQNGGNDLIDKHLHGSAAYARVYTSSTGYRTVDSNSDDLGDENGQIYVYSRNVHPDVVNIAPSGANPTYQLGGTSGNIPLSAKATDPNAEDTVKYVVSLEKSDDAGKTWTGFIHDSVSNYIRYYPGGPNHNNASGYSALRPNKTTYTVVTFNGSAYSGLAQNTSNTLLAREGNKLLNILLPKAAMAAVSRSASPVGYYRWRTRAMDNHDSASGWTGFWYFTIKADTDVYQIFPEDLKSVQVAGGKTTYPMPFEIKVVSTKKVQAKIWIEKQDSSGSWVLFKDVPYGSQQQATLAGLKIDWPAIELTPGKYRWFTKVKTDDGKEIQRAANVADAWEFTVVDPPKSCHIINYTADPKSGNQPLTVKFSGSVKDAVTQKMDYGDGTTGTSPTTHTYPTHTAPPNDKVYNATFSCTGEWSGGNESITIPITVKNPACKIATFYADPSSGGAPLTVNFPNTTIDETSTKIDYGDGTSGTKPTPHTYSAQGTYTVTYTCYGPAGNDTKQAVVTVKGWKGPSLKMSWCPGYSGTSTSLRTCLGTLSTPTFGAFGGVSVFFILLNAIQLIMARGVPIKMAKAKRGLLYSFIALGIITLSYLIVIMIYNLLA